MSNNIRYFPDGKTGRKSAQSASELGVRLVAAAIYLLMGWLSIGFDSYVINLAVMMVLYRMIYVQGERYDLPIGRTKIPILHIFLIADVVFSTMYYLGSLQANILDSLLSNAGVYLVWIFMVFMSGRLQIQRPQSSYFLKFHYMQAIVFFISLILCFQIVLALLGVFGSALDFINLDQVGQALFGTLLGSATFIHLLLSILVMGPSLYLALGALMGKTPSLPVISEYVRRWV